MSGQKQSQSQKTRQIPKFDLCDLQEKLLRLGADPEDVFSQSTLDKKQLYQGKTSRLEGRRAKVTDREDFFELFHDLMFKIRCKAMQKKDWELPKDIEQFLDDYAYIQQAWCQIKEDRPEYEGLPR